MTHEHILMNVHIQQADDEYDPCAFEILAITAGEGNGWLFGAPALRASLALWDGVETFIDHGAANDLPRSVRDLAGLCSQPAWDEAAQGIRLKLTPNGPSGAVLRRLGLEWLTQPEPRPAVGFSADLIFDARGRTVERIVRVLSLDLVVNPARGGAFMRALNQSTPLFFDPKGDTMNATTTTMPAAETASIALAAALLETRLAACSLPPALAGRIRAQFDGRYFDPAELDAALNDARRLLAELQGGAAVAGSPQISLVTGEERLQAAVDDLLGAPREKHMQSAQVERLSGLRELYTRLTGDTQLVGGYHPAQAVFSHSATLANTATLPALVKNALNKSVIARWDELGRAGYRWWEPLVTVEHFNSLNEISGVLVGEVSSLPALAEGDEYGELDINDSAETGAWVKYGGYLPLTLELIDRDDVFRLRQYPRKLASAALRTLSAQIAAVFTANSGTGPLLSDGTALFHASRGNLGSTALSSAAWEAASAAIYNKSLLVGSGTAPKLALDAKYLLVPRSLRLTGMQMLYPNMEHSANIFSENMQRGEYGDVITVPEFSDSNDWAAAADPRLAPAIIVGERFGLAPEIFIAGDETNPAMFMNDELRLKVRHYVSIFVADHRPLYKSNVA